MTPVPMRPLFLALCLSAALAAPAARAQSAADPHAGHHGAHAAPAASASVVAPTDGEVTKVDKPRARLSLKHGPLPHLDMPAMTMAFRVADPKMLDAVREGDRVSAVIERVNGAYTITAIEAR